jgi:hypothetical protein
MGKPLLMFQKCLVHQKLGHWILCKDQCEKNKLSLVNLHHINKITHRNIPRLNKLDQHVHTIQSGKMACNPTINSKSQNKFKFSLMILCTIDMHLHNLKPIFFHNTFGKKQHVNPPCFHNNNFFIMNTSHDFWNSKKKKGEWGKTQTKSLKQSLQLNHWTQFW